MLLNVNEIQLALVVVRRRMVPATIQCFGISTPEPTIGSPSLGLQSLSFTLNESSHSAFKASYSDNSEPGTMVFRIVHVGQPSPIVPAHALAKRKHRLSCNMGNIRAIYQYFSYHQLSSCGPPPPHPHPPFITATHQTPRQKANIFFVATVQKIVTEILPSSTGLAFGKDARDLLIECCVEFITLISSEANEISEKESKKTIACEHITKALEQLGFGEYVPDIMEVASEHKEQLKVCAPPPSFFFFSSLKYWGHRFSGNGVLDIGYVVLMMEIGTRKEGKQA